MSRLLALVALVVGLVVLAEMIAGMRQIAASVTIAVHVLSVGVLAGLERRIGRGAFAGLAERNRRRVTWFAILGSVIILAAAFFPVSRMVFASFVLASAATSFNLGAFAVETVSILAQWRLIKGS